MRRREFLKSCSGLLVSMAVTTDTACARSSAERCIHWYGLRERLPAILVTGRFSDASDLYYSRGDRGEFSVGLPELVVFRAASAMKPKYPRFYPFTPDQLGGLRQEITQLARLEKLASAEEVEAMFEPAAIPREGHTGVIVTLHRKNLALVAKVVQLARKRGLKELCVIKDPTLPPYLCDVKAWE